MCAVLKYGLGIFVNVGSAATYLDKYQGEAREKLYAFAVELQDGRPAIHESGSV